MQSYWHVWVEHQVGESPHRETHDDEPYKAMEGIFSIHKVSDSMDGGFLKYELK